MRPGSTRPAGRMIDKEVVLSPVPSTTAQRFATAIGVRYRTAWNKGMTECRSRPVGIERNPDGTS